MDIPLEKFVTTNLTISSFITLDLRFIITSLALKFMEITETRMKEHENEHTIHRNEHKMLLREPNMGENPARRRGLCSALFFSVIKCNYKERGTDYGVSMGTMASEWLL
jgi:PP-loop superfamily ATP-utilizing enzyme